MEIRPATAHDVPAVRDLFNALIPTTTGTWRDHLADADEMATWFAGQQAAGNPVLVAEVAGEVAGYTAWIPFRGGPRFPGYDRTVEHTIHVAAPHHGQGIGRKLHAALAEEATRRDIHVIVAAIDGENTGSIAFHLAAGFTEVARMPEVGWKFDRWLDLVLMQRILGPSPRRTDG